MIRIYAVYPLVFEISALYSLDEAFFEKIADVNFNVCFFGAKMVKCHKRK